MQKVTKVQNHIDAAITELNLPSATGEPADEPNRETGDGETVFVIHGRNEGARNSIFQFLRSLGLSPLEWNHAVRKTGSASPYTGDVVDEALGDAQAIVALLTPDDEAQLKEKFREPDENEELPRGQPRPNVIFEAGMAMGRKQARTVIIELGDLRGFSDIRGRHTIRLDDSKEKRNDLAERLETAGCEVDRTGQDWLNVGSFEERVER